MNFDLFTALTHMLDGGSALALTGAVLWGICSVVLSPCHLSGIPLLIGLISETDTRGKRRAFSVSLSFASGILLTLLAVGLFTGIAGRILGDTGPAAGIATAVFLLFFGVYLLDVLPFELFNYSLSPVVKKKGIFSAFIFGIVFGLALGPCSFAFMAPVIGLSFSIASDNFPFAVALFVAYAFGHTAVIAGAGTLTGAVKRYLAWTAGTKAANLLRKFCGVPVIAGGVFLLFTTLTH